MRPFPVSSEVLSASDYEAVLETAGRLHRHRDLETFPDLALEVLSRLIPNTFCTYNECDFRTLKLRLVTRPAEMGARAERFVPVINRYLHQHPLIPYLSSSEDGQAVTILDFISSEKLHSREVYQQALALLHVEDTLVFSIATVAHETVFFALNRSEPTFTPRDKKLANLLRPHFLASLEHSHAFDAAAAAFTLSSNGLASLSYGVVLADSQGYVVHGNSLAIELLERYFPEVNRHIYLPELVSRWVFAQDRESFSAALPFELIVGDYRLRIRQTDTGDGHRLLIIEEGIHSGPAMLLSLGITRRECEVLFWVSQGKSNFDIGIILSLSHRTVEKHLQGIFIKLGVESRTAAMILAVPLLNA